MCTILLVEDNKNIRENTVELLKMEGYRVVTAKDGSDGFEKISELRPDLIICDIIMPNMDGYALLEKLGVCPDLKGIPLIFFSAKSEKSDIEKGMAAGARDFIVKPSEIRNLLLSVNRCLKTTREA